MAVLDKKNAPQVTPTDRERAILDFFNAKGMKGSQGTIYTEPSIQDMISNISFNVLNNQSDGNQISKVEKRLKISDTFVVTKMALFIIKAGASTAATAAERAVAKQHTFENPAIFTGASESVNLYSLYRSYMSVTIDRVKFYESLDCLRFRRVGQAQQGQLVFTASNVGASQWDSADYGMFPVTPTFLINGQGDNEINISMPGSVNLAGTSSQNFVGLMLRGFLFPQSAAKVASLNLVKAFKQKFITNS